MNLGKGKIICFNEGLFKRGEVKFGGIGGKDYGRGDWDNSLVNNNSDE